MSTSVTATPEIVAFANPICNAIERIMRCLDGQETEGLNWRPPAEATNSLYVLAFHSLGSAEGFILGLLGGEQIARDRDAEFRAHGDSAKPLYARWITLQPRLRNALDAMPFNVLDQVFTHPRLGTMSGRAFLILVAQHMAEHAGHAELTRDLLKAARASMD